MEPRTIAIGLIAIVAAFGAAFAISSSGGGNPATAGAGTKAESIKVAAPAAVSGVEVGGTLPALKAEKKKAAKKKADKPASSNTTAPSTNNTTTPDTTQTTPNTTTPNTTTPNTTTPNTSTPKKSTPKNDTPVTDDGEVG